MRSETLAMRAANATKNTAALIEGTVKRIKDGSDLVIHTNAAFAKVAESPNKAGELVAEISAASSEKSQGIEQVNKAVSEMDKVVQQNAANAEENASVSEEMRSQAEHMKGYVQELRTMVGRFSKATGESIRRDSADSLGQRADAMGRTTRPTRNKTADIAPPPPQQPRLKRVIPLENDDLEDF